MIQNVLRALGGIEMYGIISICLFFTVFLVAMIFAISHRKPFCQKMSALPLDDDGNDLGSAGASPAVADASSATSRITHHNGSTRGASNSARGGRDPRSIYE